MTKAIIIVDVQNDFCPGGALAVPNGDEVVAVINKHLEDARYDVVVATQDWHPAGHQSFASSHPGKAPYDVIDLHGLPQVLWPDHCVQKSMGAEFHKGLHLGGVERIFRKGADPKVDSYSGFFDNGGHNPTGLNAYLKERGVTEVAVVGLATDYCVKATALDALRLGYKTSVIKDACRAVNINPDDGEKAFKEMYDRGTQTVGSMV